MMLRIIHRHLMPSRHMQHKMQTIHRSHIHHQYVHGIFDIYDEEKAKVFKMSITRRM